MKNKFLLALKIDKYNLDEELVRQPQLYLDAALKSAEASKEKDFAKKDLEVVRAEAEMSIRRNPKKYKLDTKNKIPEGMIKAVINLHPKVKRFNDIYLKAVNNERVLAKSEKAFSSRKKSLEGLVQLDIRLHFSEPKTPAVHKERVETEIKHGLRRSLKIRRRS